MVPKLVHVTHLPFLEVSLEFFSTTFSLEIHQLCEQLFCQKCFKMSFSSSSRMHIDRYNSVHLDSHRSHELRHTIHSDIPFFGEDIGPISFKDWMWDTEKLVQPLFSKYSHIDILRHVTSRFVGRAFDWWQERQYRVQMGRTSCINTFYELKTCMWKHFIPTSFRITKAQQARIEDFIDIGDAFIQNIASSGNPGGCFTPIGGANRQHTRHRF